MIYIYGAGGMAREVALEVREALGHPTTLIADGGTAVRLADLPKGTDIIVAVGDPALRRSMFRTLERFHLEAREWISTRSMMPSDTKRGRGCVVMAGVTVTSDVRLGDGVLLNTAATICHDCIVGDYASIQPGATLSGHVRVGREAYVGIGSTLMARDPDHPLTIGQGAIVGAGAVVIRDVEPGAVVVGNPARVLRRKLVVSA